ncbi:MULTISPECIES: HPP family protein [Peribacillus]|uniref:HPP family protein n=1 Tax=Peribacillus TaxID=2675229 RepID=UPI001F4E9D42|nr:MULTISPECIES: HPP family protein [unclassified Peribacillus]MCK1982861.1 HPP family protein [Peribacillus sp. Aquil_B1]MCK2008747.1 HPP family protein [Peribacillus sp. Aquil_B8]
MEFEKSLEKSWSNQQNIGLTAYLKKMKGEAREKDRIDYMDSLVSAIGGLIAIIMISFIAVHLGYPMALAPLGASCVIVFGAHKSLLSQPRNVIGGHIISTTSALIIWSFFGKSLFIIGLTLAIVLIIMTCTKTVHPPAAASALVSINSQAGWGFLISIVIGTLLLVFISMIYNNLFQTRQYPKHWF